MAYNYTTIGTDALDAIVNINFPIDVCTLTMVSVSVTRQTDATNDVDIACGLTPPGDEDIQIYSPLLRATLSPGDGVVWNGSIRSRSNLFLVLNYRARHNAFIYLCWATTN